MKKDKKENALQTLYNEYIETVTGNPVCDNAGGFSFVLGDGEADSRVVLVGEAPGKDEVRMGKPFVGKAGAILSEFMSGAGIVREELFITNTIKYRLARERISGEGLANRPAKTAEIRQSADFLRRELMIINPDFVVTLGNVPLKALAIVTGLEELEAGIGECHGKVFAAPESSGFLPVIVPLYHPASIIYNRSLKDIYAEDLSKLRELIRGKR